MPKEKRPVDPKTWDLESGLPNDVDAYPDGSYFGYKKEYQEVAGDQIMLILPLKTLDGEELNPPAYSIGSNWRILDGGKRVEHPTRKSFVKSSMVGQLIERVFKQLKVPLNEYGLPTEAHVWDGLGFHWIQEEHSTVSGEKRTQLMPISFLGERDVAARAGPAIAASPELVGELVGIAKNLDFRGFLRAALKNPTVTSSDSLMSQVLDEGPSGFWATHHK